MGINALKEKICNVAKTAYLKGLTAGWGGNISCLLDDGAILITPHRKSLAFLSPEDLVTVDDSGCRIQGDRKPSSELAMHCNLYRLLPVRSVIHLHPPALTTLAAREVSVELMTFESKLILGREPPIVEQTTPVVTDFKALIDAFATSNIVVLNHHGTVAVGEDLEDAFTLTDVAEEAARMTIDAYILKSVDAAGSAATDARAHESIPVLPVFSDAHMARIQSLVNTDSEAQRLGRETELTVRFAIRQAEDGRTYNMHFEKGRIVDITSDSDADFINVGPKKVWIHLFNGRLDPFAAISQGKLQLEKGQTADLSKWYAPFYRIFALWRNAPVHEAEKK